MTAIASIFLSLSSLFIGFMIHSEDLSLSVAEEAMAEGNALRREESASSLQKAIERYQTAARTFQEKGDRRRQAQALYDLGEVYDSLGDPIRALESHESALQIRRELGDERMEAESLVRVGVVALSPGDQEKALASFREALTFFQSAGDPQGQASALNGLGQAYDQFGDPENALDTYQQALSLSRTARDRREEATILSNLGMLHYRMGESDTALQLFQEALPLMEAEGYKRGQIVVTNNMALALEALGYKQGAADSYQALLSTVQTLGERSAEASVLSNLGGVFWDLGDTEKALDHHQKALAIWREAGQTAYEAIVLNNIGATYEVIGEHEAALDYFHQALPLRQSTKDRRGEGTTLSNIGNAYTEQGEPQRALDYHNRALAILREVKDRRNEAGSLHNLGKAYSDLGDKRQALDYYHQAASIRREIGDRQGLSITLGNLGIVHSFLGEPEKAVEAYTEALSLARETGDRPGEASVHLNLSRILRSSNPAKALSHIEEAIEILESRRSLTNSQNLRDSLFVAMRKYYEHYLDFLFDLHGEPQGRRAVRTLELNERARARSLLDTLLEARTEIRQGTPSELLANERDLQRKINLKEIEWKRHHRKDPANPDGNPHKRELDQLLRDLDGIRAEIRARSPKYAALTQPEPLRAEEIQTLLAPGDLLLSYFLGEKRSFLWAVTRSSLTAHEIPSREKIESAAREFHGLLSQSDKRLARRPTEQAADRLADMILAPVRKLLEKNRLVIVADGALHYIPFAALPDPDLPGQPLVVEHEIVNLPSASVLALLRKETGQRAAAPREVAILADPVFRLNDPRVQPQTASLSAEPPAETGIVLRAAKDVGLDGFTRLRYTREEADAIASLVEPGQVLKALDFDASKETATSADLSRYRILHFATHGLLDTRRPELSGLVLSLVDRQGRHRDGFLRLHEIYNLDLPADLVVLSGCETALGKEVRGEGLMAITRGFMYAGSPAVVASLWQIDDRSTGELMKRFYRGMIQEGLSAPAALRKAQVSLWKDKPTEPPYFWAGFVFQGDWRIARHLNPQ